MVTLQIALGGLGLAILLGGLGARVSLSRFALMRGVGRSYVFLVRGVPDLVMMLLVYFGGQRLINSLSSQMGWERIEVSPFAAGIFTIGFIFGGYLTETFRGAFRAIAKGQLEAAAAIGLGRMRTLLRIISPQLMRHALPGFSNVWQVLMKSTAIVSVIGLQDIVYVANIAGKSNREPFLFLLGVIVFYLALTSLSGFVLNHFERRLNVGERR